MQELRVNSVYIYGKCYIPSVKRFANAAFESVPMFDWLPMAFSRPTKEDCRAFPLSTPPSARQSMVWCPFALCPQVVTRTPQHCRSSVMQAIYDSWFTCQSICSGISLNCLRARGWRCVHIINTVSTRKGVQWRQKWAFCRYLKSRFSSLFSLGTIGWNIALHTWPTARNYSPCSVNYFQKWLFAPYGFCTVTFNWISFL